MARKEGAGKCRQLTAKAAFDPSRSYRMQRDRQHVQSGCCLLHFCHLRFFPIYERTNVRQYFRSADPEVVVDDETQMLPLAHRCVLTPSSTAAAPQSSPWLCPLVSRPTPARWSACSSVLQFNTP